MNYFYKITNLINHKFYYGVHKTDNPNDSYLGSGTAIKYAVKKYGRNNFKKEILYTFDTYQEALDYEEAIVNEIMIADPACYNLKKGGIGGWSFIKGKPMSKEHKEKISLSKKGQSGYKHTKESKNKIGKFHKNKTLSKDHKNKLSIAKKGKPLSETHKQRLREAAKNLTKS